MLTTAMRRLRELGIFGLAPGLLDAGFASLAGLVGSLYAARFFEVSQLGLFSLFFVTFQLLGLLPARLLLVPAQVAALDLPIGERTAVLSKSVPLGLISGLAATPLVWLVLVLAPDGDRADYIAFGITTSTMVMLSPLQDHCRFMLHMAERSPAAAMVSALQFAIALVSLIAMHVLDVPVRWIPFLSLSIANLSSLSLAVFLARPWQHSLSEWPGVRVLLRSGRLLLPAELLPFLGLLGTSVLVARLASTEALGSAEAARVVASPVLVAGTGLGQVLWPRIMGAARTAEHHDLVRASRLLAAGVAAITALYVAVVGWSHPLNVMEALIPLAFTVTGLVAFRAVAAAASVMVSIPASALLGTENNRLLLSSAAVAVVAQLVIAAAVASAIGAHAVPAAQLVGAVTTIAVMFIGAPALREAFRPGAARVAA